MQAHDRCAYLVRGFLPKVDQLPARARALGLVYRNAVAQESCREGFADMFFDEELFFGLLQLFADLVGADRADVIREKEVEPLALPVSSAARASLSSPYGPELRSVTYWREGRVVASAVYVAWDRLGGPYPYHDTYTLELYTTTDVGAAFDAKVRDFCGALQVKIDRIFRGPEAPVAYHWASRALEAVGAHDLAHLVEYWLTGKSALYPMLGPTDYPADPTRSP